MTIPPFRHRSALELLLNSLCSGRVKALLRTIAASLNASCMTFADNNFHTWTRKGYPVSLIFLKQVVKTIIVKLIQNSTKKPLKSR